MHVSQLGQAQLSDDRIRSLQSTIDRLRHPGDRPVSGAEAVRVEEAGRLIKITGSRKKPEHKPQPEHFEHQVETAPPATYSRDLSYIKHRPTNRYYARVIDAATREVVREIPPPEELDRKVEMLKFLKLHFGV